MKAVIECWKDHHEDWDKKTIRNFNDLYNLIHDGYLWHQESVIHDQKVIITIEAEE